MTVILSPEAEFDLTAAYRWYEERDTGLGAEFMRAVETSIYQIQRHPEMYPIAHRGVRQAITRRFPFSILYVIQEQTAYVVAVFHAARDPQNWKNRA